MSRTKRVLAGVLVFCMIFGLATNRFVYEVEAQKAKVANCDINAEYELGTTFTVPSGDVSYKDETKSSDKFYVVFPSGKAKNSTEIVLEEEGQYNVVYQAKFGETTISAKKTFVVKKSLFSVRSDKSTAIIKDNKINVALATDDTFTYNKAMDLSTATKEKSLLTLEMNPNEKGKADALALKIRFTDLYDTENYLTITLKNTGDIMSGTQSYISAGASNQPQVGVENLEDAVNTNVHVNDTFGTPVYFSMTGTPMSSMDTQLKLYMDYENLQLFVDREIYSGAQNRMIVDLDDSNYFGTDIWKGFKTGEVKMTIMAENYQSSTCNFTLAEVNGETEFNDLGDSEPPVIKVESGYKEDNLPKALVGKPYKLFKADAFDKYDGKIDVMSSVYYKYYTSNPVKLQVKDGTFTPTEVGIYTIEYKSVDTSGNEATKCLKIYAIKSDGLKVELKKAAKDTFTGQAVKVVDDIVCSDNSGKIEYSIVAKNLETGEETQISASNKLFTPMSDGKYQIIVKVNDYVSTVEKTFEIESKHTSQPQIYDNVAMQNYFIKGAKYQIPNLSGYDFSSGKGKLKDMRIFVVEKGGKEKEITDGYYTPEKIGDVKIIYRLTVDGLSCEKVYKAKVVDTGYTGDLELDKYFAVTNGDVKAKKEATHITYSTKADARLEFVNFVQTKKLSFSFQVGKKNDYNRINIYLTDSLTKKQVKVSYRKKGDIVECSVNDDVWIEAKCSFTGMDRNFSFEYSNDTMIVVPATGINLKVDKYTDGCKFEGFTDSMAIFALELEDVKGESQLVVNNLNSQSMNNTKIDRFAPEIIVDTKSGDRGIGEDVKFDGAFAYDTLDPISTLTMSVTDPDGKAVKDNDGVALDGKQDPGKDYTIKLAKYGDYTVTYVATDGKGKSTEYVYAITSKDVEAPKVEIKKHKDYAKKGDNIKIAEVETSDNITKKCKVNSFVFDKNGVSVEVKDGKFTATMSGTYSVRYMVSDESGNYTFESYKIDVKE